MGSVGTRYWGIEGPLLGNQVCEGTSGLDLSEDHLPYSTSLHPGCLEPVVLPIYFVGKDVQSAVVHCKIYVKFSMYSWDLSGKVSRYEETTPPSLQAWAMAEVKACSFAAVSASKVCCLSLKVPRCENLMYSSYPLMRMR